MEAGSYTMKVVNAVFSKQDGGLEQASVDYTRALHMVGCEMLFLTGTRATYDDRAEEAGASKITKIANRFGYHDVLAMWTIRRWLQQEKPDIVFAHGNRAICLLRKAARGIVPVIAVNHTINVKHSVNAEHIITVNSEQKQELLDRGHKDAGAIHVVYNMVYVTPEQCDYTPPPLQSPPVFGVMARLWTTKGIDVFLRAAGILQRRGVDFRAVIGGAGPLKDQLYAVAKEENVTEKVHFAGWLKDREAFYRGIDIFCLPSRQETFGIVVLEAFQHKKPVIASAVSGPLELSAGRDVALFVPPEDAEKLADAMQQLLHDPARRETLVNTAFTLLQERYTMPVIAQQLKHLAEQVINAASANITR